MVYIGVDYISERAHRTRFVSADWKTPTLIHARDSIRMHMVDDLLGRYHLVGMTKAEVLSLLGRPDDTMYGAFEYYLGAERGWLKIDDEILRVSFGPSGRVASAVDTVD